MKQRGFGILAYLLAAIALTGLIGTGVYKVKKWGGDEVRAEWAEANRLQREKEAAQASAALTRKETGDAKAKVIYRTITREVDKVVIEWRDRPCLDAHGLRLARCAILGKSLDSCKPDESLPAPARPSGRDGGVGLALDRGSLGRLP